MKKKKPIKSKRKTHDVFHQKPYSKRMSRRRVAISDNIIVSLFTMGCCKVLSSLSVWELFLTMKNSYHKALVPLRRVTYYKHVKFDLRDNITSRDVTKKVRIWREPASRTRCSGNSPQNPVLKTSRNGYLDLSLRRTRKKKVMVLVNEFDHGFPIFYKTSPKVKVEECCQSHLDSAL